MKSRGKQIRFFILVILFILTDSLYGQTSNLRFSHLDINNGLSHNQINCILKDTKGFMWFGTMSGLNRFDGYTFRVFRHNPEDSLSINDNYIISITEDQKGNLWINTRNGFTIYNPESESFSDNIAEYLANLSIPVDSVSGIYNDKNGCLWVFPINGGIIRLNPADGNITLLYHNSGDTGSILSNDVSDFIQDQEGNFWLTTHNGILQKIDGRNLKMIYKDFRINHEKGGQWIDYKLFVDNENELWIYADSYSSGVYFFNPKNNSLQLICKETGKVRLNNNIIKGIVQDNLGTIWIGTDHGGINLLDKQNNVVQYIVSNPYDTRSLSHNSITAMYKDDIGIIWAGTFKKGINYYHENIIRFGLIKHQSVDPSNLAYDDVNAFCEDSRGNLWIGTNGGGLIYFNRQENNFTHYKYDPTDRNSLSNDVIISLYLDSENKLWIGTFYGGLNYFDGTRFHHYKHNPADPESLADDRVWEIAEDSEKRLWIGTLGGGLDLFDRSTGRFKHFKHNDANSVGSDFIFSITEDRQKNLWIGTAHGISILDKQSGIFKHILRESINPHGLSNNNVISIICDSRGWMWVGTREGLNLYNQQKASFLEITRIKGLADNAILSIREDNQGNLWLATSSGLSNINIDPRSTPDSLFLTVKNYDEPDGLQGKVFNERAAYKTRYGELLFGGANGFNIFRPQEIKTNRRIPTIEFTGFEIFNSPVRVNEKINGRVIFARAISETKEIVLRYHENMFSIEFAALDYFQPQKNKYQYRLDGFNTGWIECDDRLRKATYTNLNPGDYVFHVKASNNDGYWNDTGVSMKIRVLPPFWKTKTAFALYFIAISLLLILLRYIVLERERMNFRVQQQRQEADRRHEIDMLKIKFITNISHEFKTPLSLIISPVEKMLKSIDKPELQNQLLMVFRNARRLLNLVNQLLDFRRMEFQQIKLSPTLGDIVAFSRDITHSFSDLTEKKNIELHFKSEIENLKMIFDHDKIEKIIFNLLSNALKFTPEKGTITVSLSQRIVNDVIKVNGNSDMSWVLIKVQDTGIGIPKEKQEKVFERFYQIENPRSQIKQGTGIGLSLVNEFVKLHNGKIELESEEGRGSCFTVMLPAISESDMIEFSRQSAMLNGESPLPVQSEIKDHRIEGNPSILIVEDNEDFLFYLKDYLKTNYNIIEAHNGSAGLKLARDFVPDLIVSDIMMPEMDGIEMCRAIKNDKRTSHIPVILLTARASDNLKVEGFETGAEDYITKPFSFEILESRIKNLIQQREKIKKSFQKRFELTPSEIQITSLDEKLIQKAVSIVEKNLSDPDFSVDILAREVGMSRVHLYKKLTSLTGKSPIEFIRVIRLRRAAQLLEKSQLTIAEVAYQVGFNNPKYFTKYFKDEHKVLPSEYAANKMKNDKNSNLFNDLI
jgi:signal transduction histidine kinase/ligand-binding sensor domain-containing protein/DNA-binding response OmpR family regulator